jgi:dihydroorotase
MNQDNIVLERTPWEVPASYALGSERVIPMRAGETINWKLVPQNEG